MIHINQYTIDKQNLGKKNEGVDKKTPTVLNTNIKEIDNKIPDLSGLVKKTDYDAKISEFKENTLLILILINFKSDVLDAKIKQIISQ